MLEDQGQISPFQMKYDLMDRDIIQHQDQCKNVYSAKGVVAMCVKNVKKVYTQNYPSNYFSRNNSNMSVLVYLLSIIAYLYRFWINGLIAIIIYVKSNQ